MPRACDRSIVCTLILGSDKDKPYETQPRFFCPSLNMREQMRLGSLLDGITAVKNSVELYETIVEVLGSVLSGWINMATRDGTPIPYSKEAIFDVLDFREGYELARLALTSSSISESDRKKSDSSP
jgi:hypothetical protein